MEGYISPYWLWGMCIVSFVGECEYMVKSGFTVPKSSRPGQILCLGGGKGAGSGGGKGLAVVHKRDIKQHK